MPDYDAATTTSVLFVSDMARRLGITEKAVRRRLEDRRGSLPPPCRGLVGGRRRVYWPRAAVERWLR